MDSKAASRTHGSHAQFLPTKERKSAAPRDDAGNAPLAKLTFWFENEGTLRNYMVLYTMIIVNSP